MSEKVLFLHGLGDTVAVWQPIIAELPQKYEAVSYPVVQPGGAAKPWELSQLAADIANTLTAPVHVVGVSLGAVVALQLSISHPQLVRSLCISAPQAKPPRALLQLQQVLLRLLPAKIVCPPELTKTQLLAVTSNLATLNLEPHLPAITVRTTVLCGSKDLPNLRAARQIAARIPHAKLEVVSGVGHLWHHSAPQLFSAKLRHHLAAPRRV